LGLSETVRLEESLLHVRCSSVLVRRVHREERRNPAQRRLSGVNTLGQGEANA
jgi:hypothetical protein